MALICRTFSLATLKNVFPEADYWRQPPPSSTTIPTASPYVHIYTGKGDAACLSCEYISFWNCRSRVGSPFGGFGSHGGEHPAECGKNCPQDVLRGLVGVHSEQEDQIQVRDRDTTIALMTIRRMLIERLFFASSLIERLY